MDKKTEFKCLSDKQFPTNIIDELIQIGSLKIQKNAKLNKSATHIYSKFSFGTFAACHPYHAYE
ncbi:hypothetical protein BpHYR1_046676 [Brachionus plicatilis]|uniref:Uncharacterized protein n=1 Tax=Brachionus plicatilis TaxID=10195 RepID=A0A3M7RVE5_BRAPC|nr:hypothetical protein BpHYR1_046676 [Brachionus plicatilis]